MDPGKSAGEGSSSFAAEDSGNIFDWFPSLLPLQFFETGLSICPGRPLLKGLVSTLLHRRPMRGFSGKGPKPQALRPFAWYCHGMRSAPSLSDPTFP